MSDTSYEHRRGEIETYFNRTAVDAWKRFATQAPLGRIRESVRAGRAQMRAAMLSTLPDDLQGWKILDAGCGTGAMSVELARRGADVFGVDIAPEIIRFAQETLPGDLGRGRVAFQAGDMLSPAHGSFDAVVAMDCLIHYSEADAAAALATLAPRTSRKIVFTFAPWTPPLATLHAVGRFFPRSDRAPAIVPVRLSEMRRRIAGEGALSSFVPAATGRIAHGFYTSQFMELTRR